MTNDEPIHEAMNLDSSALVKRVIAEGESDALRRYRQDRPIRVFCALGRVEVPLAVARHKADASARAHEVLYRKDSAREMSASSDRRLETVKSVSPDCQMSVEAWLSIVTRVAS